MKKFIITIIISIVTAATLSLSTAFAEPKDAATSSVIPGQYIVVFNDSVAHPDTTSTAFGRTHGLEIANTYSHALKGFAAVIPDARLKVIKSDPRVAFVSEDREVTAVDNHGLASKKGGGTPPVQPPQVVPTGVSRIGASSSMETGLGVGVAVIDTGIDLTHPDLMANIGSVNKTCVRRTVNANDDDGHGSHVAGTIAAENNTIGVVGVAPKAKLFAVKVLDRNGSGTWSSVICGIDWVTANAATYNIKVANMSLAGSGKSDNNCGNTNNDALHKAICKSVASGVTYVVAASNEGKDASTMVPAAYNDAVITVSALADSDGFPGGSGPATSYGADDTFATFSNYGAPVDIGAPGVSIFSTWKGGGYNTISGTSMATPHVAGAAALYIAAHPTAVWTEVRDALVAAGEVVGFGHTDPSGLHPEPVLWVSSL